MNHFINYLFSIGVDAIIARFIITRFTRDKWLSFVNAISILWYLIINVSAYPDVAIYSILAGIVVFGLFTLFDHTIYRQLSFSLPHVPMGKTNKTETIQTTAVGENPIVLKDHPQKSQFSFHMPQFIKN